VKPCACGCGRMTPQTYRAFGEKKELPRKFYDRTRCPQRMKRKFKEPPEIVECACGCGRTFPDRTKHGRPRRWWSSRCCRPGVALSAQAMQNKRDREAVRRSKVAGRECSWCGKDDSDGKWGSGSVEACENCRRQMSKKRCRRCGGPVYVYAHKPTGRLAGCVLQNRVGSCGG